MSAIRCPFLVGATFAFSLSLIGLSFLAPGEVASYIAGLGMASGVIGLLLVAYSVLAKPSLLRSERHQEISRMIEIVGDNDQPLEVRHGIQETLVAFSNAPKRFIDDGKRESGDD